MATLDLWYSKLAEHHACPGRILQARLRLFRFPLSTFERNCDELVDALRALKPATEPDDETVFEFGDWVAPQLELITLRLHNFLAAAMTLVDQSRLLYREVYEKEDLIPDYGAEVTKRFKENGLHQFVQGMRNMTLHCRLPPVGYTEHRSTIAGEPPLRHEIYFSKPNLLEFNGWTSPARRFLNDAPEPFAVAPVVTAYRDGVADFHRWFAEQRREAHKVQIEEAERLDAELRQLANELRAAHHERVASARA